MHEHLSQYPNLLIVSDTAMRLVKNESYVAFEPVVREFENIQHLFTGTFLPTTAVNIPRGEGEKGALDER